MSINLDKFKYDLVEGWREVMDSKIPTDWAVFGYDGQSFDLKLVNKGTGGLDEMIDNLNSGRIMYALCRVKLKDRNTEKIALINWQGEGAPMARKGTCANHVNTVKHFFKGIHVTINARTEEDVEPEAIIGSVVKATSGEGISMTSSTELEPNVEPVGAVYKKVNPQEEINAGAKDEFWRKEEAEEENRKKAEKNRMTKFSQNEVKLLRKESQDYFEQEQLERRLSMTSPPSSSASPVLLASTVPTTNGNNITNGTNSGNSSESQAVTPAFIASQKAEVMQSNVPHKSSQQNLVRQRIKSFDANPNETLLTFNMPTTDAGVRSGSRSPADGESLSVLKRRELFESGRVSNTSQRIVKKDAAQEIKSLLEESQAMTQVSTPPRQKSVDYNPPATSPPPTNTNKSPTPPKTAPSPSGIKAYNLPFHIGGSVTSRLADQVNRNASSRPSSGSGSIENGGGGSLSSISSNKSLTFSGKEDGLMLASNVVKAEFQATPVIQQITTNFEQNSTTMNTSTIPESNQSIEEVEIESSPPKNTSPTPSPITKELKICSSPPIPPEQVKNMEDTSVKSGEVVNISEIAQESILENDGRRTPKIPPSVTPVGTSTTVVMKPEMGLCARALYDYQAGDDSEITFDPGDIITNIETIDEGWWEGMGPQGVYGLFPANYVELLN